MGYARLHLDYRAAVVIGRTEGTTLPDPQSPSEPSHLSAIERRFIDSAKRAQQLEEGLLPAWLRPTEGEHRWQMGVAVVIAIGLQLSLPAHLAVRPHYVVPIAEGAILLGVFVTSPARLVRHSPGRHATALVLMGLISADTAISAGLLVHEIVSGTADAAPRRSV